MSGTNRAISMEALVGNDSEWLRVTHRAGGGYLVELNGGSDRASYDEHGDRVNGTVSVAAVDAAIDAAIAAL